MATTWGDLITDAFFEVNILGAGETLSAEDAAFGLGKMNRLIDTWNAKRVAVYQDQLSTFTLTTSLNPHTIGPTGATWTLSQRPVSIVALNLVINSSRVPVRVYNNDVGWYAGVSMPTISGDPTAVYYEADWPNGKLYFDRVPSTAYTVDLWARVVLASVAAADTFSLPPGYRDALTLSLAETLTSAYPGAVVSTDLKDHARDARAVIFANNDVVPSMTTAGSGLPGGSSGGFSYRTGMVR